MKRTTLLIHTLLVAILSIGGFSRIHAQVVEAPQHPADSTQVEENPALSPDSNAPVVKKRSVEERRRMRKGGSDAEQQQDNKGISVRLQNFNERLKQNTDNVPWKRVIYRQVDVDSADNAVLYYPPRPTDTDENLFTMLFRLLNKGAIKAYEYRDGYEAFDKSAELKFGDFLDRFGILATVSGDASLPTSYTIQNADIPSDLVKSYYVKEEYYFDPIRSTTDRRVIAICPILYDNAEDTETLHFPLFWVKYDDIRPFLTSHKVMMSNLNNASNLTLDDFFRLSMYQGSIYKTLNLRGLSLAQYCPTPDSLHHEQQRIEKELAGFESTLWSRAARETAAAEQVAQQKSESDEQEGTTQEATEAKTSRAERQQELSGNSSKRIKKSKKRSSKSKAARSANSKRSARNRF